MKKALKVIGILFVVLFVVPLIATAISPDLATAVISIYMVALIALPFVLLIRYIRRKKQSAGEKEAQGPAGIQGYSPAAAPQRVPVQRQAAPVAVKPAESSFVDDGLCVSDEADADYHYSCVGIYMPELDVLDRPEMKVGTIIRFQQEQENRFDSGAVAVMMGRKRIGYLYRGKIQDMANDWLSDGDIMRGEIAYIDRHAIEPKKNAVKINIYFYSM